MIVSYFRKSIRVKKNSDIAGKKLRKSVRVKTFFVSKHRRKKIRPKKFRHGQQLLKKVHTGLKIFFGKIQTSESRMLSWTCDITVFTQNRCLLMFQHDDATYVRKYVHRGDNSLTKWCTKLIKLSSNLTKACYQQVGKFFQH